MILFVCSQGALRSRTAELLCLFGGMDARCCGIDHDALSPVSDSQLRVADLVICMESKHKEAMKELQHYGQCDLITLSIDDIYNRLDPELIDALIAQIGEKSPRISAAMQRGANVLARLEGYPETLGMSFPQNCEQLKSCNVSLITTDLFAPTR